MIAVGIWWLKFKRCRKIVGSTRECGMLMDQRNDMNADGDMRREGSLCVARKGKVVGCVEERWSVGVSEGGVVVVGGGVLLLTAD